MKELNAIICYLFICAFSYAQNRITGTFAGLANQQVELVGFNGFNTYSIDKTTANEKGEFNLSFDKVDCGMAYLLSQDDKSFVVVLALNENLVIAGYDFSLPESIAIKNGKQNKFFEQYASEHPRREQCLSAWSYLGETYNSDTLFSEQKSTMLVIESEMNRIKREDSLFLASVPKSTFLSYYLPLRKLVSSVSILAQQRPKEIPAAIKAFQKLDYNDARLCKSGLLKDAIESHFWLIENSGRSLESVYVEMKISIDRMLVSLLEDEQNLNEITEHLFTFLEQRSLFLASEYLAIQLLNQKTCTLSTDFASQLESYRAMKKGNIEPNIVFTDNALVSNLANGTNPKELSDINSKYKVVVFGASWCPRCQKDLLTIASYYKKWKQQEVEVIFISLDDDHQVFSNFAQPFPFISTCDYKKWESPIVKDYHVFATPTIYLLDNKHEILLKPNSVSQLNFWIDWYLVQGNKKNETPTQYKRH